MSILYISGMTPDGLYLMGGLWKWKTQEGFPLDMAYEICKDHKYCPDWFEAMCQAGAVELPAFEFDNLIAEMNMLVGPALTAELVDKFKVIGALSMVPEDTFQSVCLRMLERKKEFSLKLPVDKTETCARLQDYEQELKTNQ